MAMPGNTDVTWYLVTRKGSNAHFVFNENYIANYESEFERIREFDSLEEANAALAARKSADEVHRKPTQLKKLRSAKVRGDIKKGSIPDEDVRAQVRAEIEAEIAIESAKAGKPTAKAKEALKIK